MTTSSAVYPRASVIIPAHNAGRELPECLAGIANNNSSALEVIVVDDGSHDETASVAKSQGATIISLRHSGPAAARNAGAREASGEFLVFIDADCVPQPGCLAALLEPFSDPRVAGVRGGYTTSQSALVARFAQLELEEKQARLAASTEVSVVDTACAAYRRSVFMEHGGFDERFPATSAEDVELSFRLASRGERLVFAANAAVSHHHPDRIPRYLWRKLRFGFFRVQLYGEYPGRLRDDGYTPRLMPIQIGLAGLITGSLLASIRFRLARPILGASVMAFLASSIPLVRASWVSDRSLTPHVPALLLARSFAQGLGLAGGLAFMGLRLKRASHRRLGVLAEPSLLGRR